MGQSIQEEEGRRLPQCVARLPVASCRLQGALKTINSQQGVAGRQAGGQAGMTCALLELWLPGIVYVICKGRAEAA